MKTLCSTVIMLVLIGSGVLFSGTVAELEYYFDSDPGLGQGTPLYSRNTVDLNPLISTAALDHGFHRIYIRAKNSVGQWGLPQRANFYIPHPSPQILPPHGSVAQIEYFFDADPGQGLATQVYTRNNVDINQLISSAAVDPGFHRIYVRAKNSSGQWGLPQNHSFYIPQAVEPSEPYQNITQIEYFVGTDPGFGNGVVVSVTPGSSLSLNIPSDMSAVEDGLQTLYLRAKTASGVWGFPAKVLFSNGVPASLSINIVDGSVFITWEELYGIDTYKVYSATEPGGSYLEDSSGVFGASSWTAPQNPAKRFFRVSSVYDEIE